MWVRMQIFLTRLWGVIVILHSGLSGSAVTYLADATSLSECRPVIDLVPCSSSYIIMRGKWWPRAKKIQRAHCSLVTRNAICWWRTVVSLYLSVEWRGIRGYIKKKQPCSFLNRCQTCKHMSHAEKDWITRKVLHKWVLFGRTVMLCIFASTIHFTHTRHRNI